MPPKKKTQHHAAKQAFYYLTSFFALALVATGLGILFYELIEYYFPQETGYGGFSQSSVKFGISTLVIAAPIYYFFMRYINTSLSKKDLDDDSGIRRWLTYIVMFVAVTVTLGDLIAVLNEYLDGSITIRFLLKALTIFAIAGGVFLYYFLDMSNASDSSRRLKNNLWAGVFWIAVLAPLVWAFTIFESPSEARLRNIDEQLVSELQMVKGAVEEYARVNGGLPQSIQELEQRPEQYIRLDDLLLTQYGFEYHRVSQRQFELCALFERDNTEDRTANRYGYYDWQTDWEHPMGNHCFDFEIPRDFLDAAADTASRDDWDGRLERLPNELAPPPLITPGNGENVSESGLPNITDAPPPPQAPPPAPEGIESPAAE